MIDGGLRSQELDLHVFTVGGRSFVFDVQTATPLEVDEAVASIFFDISRLGLVRGFKEIAAETNSEETSEDDGLARVTQLLASGLLRPKGERTPAVVPDVPRQPISNVHLMLTNACTMNCIYCYGQSEFELHAADRQMEEQTALDAVDFLLKESLGAQKVSVTFFGGEPTLRMDTIESVVRYGRKAAEKAGKTIRFDLTTNGSLLTENTIQALNDLDVGVLLSMDGPEDIQRKNRPFFRTISNELLHDQTLGRIRQFIEARNGNVGVRATIVPEDADRLPELLRYFNELGVDRVALGAAEDTYEIGARSVPKVVAQPQVSAATIENRELTKGAAYLTRLLTGAGLTDLKLERLVSQLYTDGPHVHGCGAGRGMVTVESNGDVLPCYRFIGQDVSDNPLVAGNVSRGIERTKLRISQQLNVDALDDCQPCWARYVCAGGCQAESYAAVNDAIKNRYDSEACVATRKRIEVAVWIIAQLKDHAPEILSRIEYTAGFEPDNAEALPSELESWLTFE